MEKEDNGRDRFAMKETDPQSPSPLPEPQDLREALTAARDDLVNMTLRQSTLDQIDAALAQSDAELRLEEDARGTRRAMLGGYQMPDALIPSLEAQSDARPVGWQRRRVDADGWKSMWYDCPDNEHLNPKEGGESHGVSYSWEYRPLYTAPPRPDASALIEAAEIYRKALERISKSNSYDMNTLHPEGCAHVAAEALRAADRSAHGKVVPDCPTEGVAARQGNGG